MKRTTWVLLILLLLVAAGYLLFQNRPVKEVEPTPAPTTASSFLFSTADGALTYLRIDSASRQSVQVQRDANGTWQIVLPSAGLADQGLAGAAETQVGALSILANLTNPPAAKEMGLDAPAYSIKLSFSQGKSHTLEVGKLTPTSSGYYVRLDGSQFKVVSRSGIDALLNLLAAPPYAPTATPTETPILPTATPTY